MRLLLMFCPHLHISSITLKWLRVFRVCVRDRQWLFRAAKDEGTRDKDSLSALR